MAKRDEQPKATAPRGVAGLKLRVGAAVEWISAHRLVSAVGAAILSVLFVAGIAWFVFAGRGDEPVTLEMALRALDEGAFVQARHDARQLQETRQLGPGEFGGPAFVLGVLAYYDGEDALGRSKADYYALASRYLEQAQSHGFPTGREAQGMLLLGRSLFRSGQLRASRLVLEAALPLNPEHAAELHRMLARAWIDDVQPDYRAGLEHISLYLDTPRLSRYDRDEGVLLKSQILFQLDEAEACRETLAELGEGSTFRAEATIVEGRLLMREAAQLEDDDEASETVEGRARIEQLWQTAMQQLRSAQGADTLENQTTAKSMYLIGLCLLALGDEQGGLDQLQRTSQLYFDTPEGVAAALKEAELLLKLQRNEPAAAAYRTVLAHLSRPDEFRNPWLSLDVARERLLAGYEQLLERERFELATELLQQFYPLFTRTRTVQLQAQCQQRWARSLLQGAESLPPLEAEAQARTGRMHAREAGKLFVRLARLRFVSREYPEDLWNAAESFLEGRDYRHAVEFFTRYLNHEARQRRPRVLVGLAEAYLAQDKLDEAIAACQECIEFFGLDAASFRARLVGSQALLEKGEAGKAEQWLRDNLQGDYLTPSSREWRHSLFALGRLFHLEQRWEEAIPPLEEALLRYPDDRRSLDLRYLLADAHHQLGLLESRQAREASVVATRVVHLRKMQQNLQRAVEQYERLQGELAEMETKVELSALQRATLRNCYFARGAALASLQQYDAAVEAFSLATNRFQSSPVVLEAYVSSAEIYRRMNQPDEARGILQQAKVVLRRLPEDAPFREATNFNAAEWGDYLDWLLSL